MNFGVYFREVFLFVEKIVTLVCNFMVCFNEIIGNFNLLKVICLFIDFLEVIGINFVIGKLCFFRMFSIICLIILVVLIIVIFIF